MWYMKPKMVVRVQTTGSNILHCTTTRLLQGLISVLPLIWRAQLLPFYCILEHPSPKHSIIMLHKSQRYEHLTYKLSCLPAYLNTSITEFSVHTSESFIVHGKYLWYQSAWGGKYSMHHGLYNLNITSKYPVCCLRCLDITPSPCFTP